MVLPLARRHTTTRVLAFEARPNETHDARLVILRRRRASRDARDATRATHDDERGRDLDARRLDRRATRERDADERATHERRRGRERDRCAR